MKNYVTKARFQKFAPIDRKFPIYELVEDNDVLLDVGASEDGVIEVALHQMGANRIFYFEQLSEWLSEGKKLIEEEMMGD